MRAIKRLGVLWFVGVLCSVSFEAPQTVYGPQVFFAKPMGVVYQTSFSNAIADADGVLTVVNGNGASIPGLLAAIVIVVGRVMQALERPIILYFQSSRYVL